MVGRMAATTPTGTPISITLSSGISRSTPTVFIPRMRARQQIGAQQILRKLVLARCRSRSLRRPVPPDGARARVRRGHALDDGVDLLLAEVRYFCQAA